MAFALRMRWTLIPLVLGVLVATVSRAEPPVTSAADLVGKPAQRWEVSHWIHSRPLELADLRGRVVLLRFWTAPGCPYCRATAPALNDFHRRYGDRGLSVVGFYHHKASGPLDPKEVERQARAFGFEFPVAIDVGWTTLQRYWLDHAPRAFTSVSFLIDRQGTIRHVHPGGQYVRGDRAFRELEAHIEALLHQPPP
jgi:thiol-disulfide isomerase/thioredoxin